MLHVYNQRMPRIRLCPYFCPSVWRFSASGLGQHGWPRFFSGYTRCYFVLKSFIN